MYTDWRAYVGRDGWRWRLARALTPRSRRVRRIRGVLLSGCAGYRVRPCADAALRGIESTAPTPEEINAARVWLSEIKFVDDLVGSWRRGTFSSAALVRLAQRTGLESAHEAAIRVIDRETRAPGGELFAVSPRTERLVLTEDAALVWSNSLPVLHEFWPDEANRPRWFMTGGAVLGTRWGGHRQSPHVDVQILPRQAGQTSLGLIEMTRGWLPWFRPVRRLDARMRAIGAWCELAEHGHRLYWFFFPGRNVLPHPKGAKLDLFERSTAPRWPVVVTTIGSDKLWTASTAQILHGKLSGRGHLAQARDLFDVAVARHVEPDALRSCLPFIAQADVESLIERWRSKQADVTIDAVQTLSGIADEWAHVARDPVKHAVEALQWAASTLRSRR